MCIYLHITYIFTKKILHTAKKRHNFLFTKFKKLAGRLCREQRRDKIRIKRSHTSNSKYNANVNRIGKTLQRTIRYHLDPLNNVINLSTKSFTFYEFKLLNKNLNFCPTPNRYNKKQFKNDIETFIRKVKLKAHFKNKEQDIEKEEFRISRNKTWTPKENHHTVEKFAQAFQKREIKQIPHKNLSKKEEDALQNLSKRNDIIITKADKGGAVVIGDVDDYIQEANRQLDNKEFYKKLTIDTTEINRIKVNRTINELKSSHLLNEKIANDLLSSEAKTPQFKMLPKVHKEGNPSRPVVSSIDCHTTKISKYIDNQLQPHVKELKSYVKDSTDFIRKINSMEKIPDNSILVTMDVRSLYTNIPNKEGIEAVETTLKRKNIGTTIILTFLRLVLTLNNFVFNSQNYLQIKGCAMGTKCAPSYANIFMGMFEERYICPLIEKISNFYLRFIDDICLTWTGTTDQLMKFKQQINEVHPSIKFDFNFSNKEINFLDTVVYKTQSGKLETKLYRKESDRQAYLHRKSEHPESLKRSIPFSQALRLRRICSTNNEFQDSCDKLRNK